MICRDIREVICSSIIADHHSQSIHKVLVTHRIPISIGLLEAALCQGIQEDMQGVLPTPLMSCFGSQPFHHMTKTFV